VKYLIEHGADVNKESNYGETPLLSACESGRFITRLLNRLRLNINFKLNNLNINPNSKYNYIYEAILKNDKTPLFIACESENKTNVKYLIKHSENENRNITLYSKNTSVKENIIKCLVDHGANVNKELHNGITLILIACESGNETIIKYLVDHGANVNKELRNGKTPLNIACKSRNETIVKFLVEHGADINRPISIQINTPLIIACGSGNSNMI